MDATIASHRIFHNKSNNIRPCYVTPAVRHRKYNVDPSPTPPSSPTREPLEESRMEFFKATASGSTRATPSAESPPPSVNMDDPNIQGLADCIKIYYALRHEPTIDMVKAADDMKSVCMREGFSRLAVDAYTQSQVLHHEVKRLMMIRGFDEETVEDWITAISTYCSYHG